VTWQGTSGATNEAPVATSSDAPTFPALPQTPQRTPPPSSTGVHPRRPSRFLLRFFDIYLSLYVPLHFRALRLAHPERFPITTRPLIIVINHPSWWDPLTSILLSRFFLPQADHYAPIDAISLPRHKILSGLGLFPVEQGTPRGAVQFLRAAQTILSNPNSLLWLTPQGSFTDVRARPVTLKSGLASLLKRLEEVTVLPLAYEYTFWDEPRPEILTSCGHPLLFRHGRLVSGLTDHASPPRAGTTGLLDPSSAIATALAAAQDELAALALTRNPACFRTIMAGRADPSSLRAIARNLHAAIFPRPYIPPAASSKNRP
jgi:1-acyl-sn-glycerol-3-phosphate acyltransferase